MIQRKIYLWVIILIFLFSLSCPLLVQKGACASVDEISLHIIGEAQRNRAGNPVLVAGVWHYLNITLINSEPSKLSVIMYKGSTLPDVIEQDESTYYSWEYDGSWKDTTGYGENIYSYITESNCKKTGKTYSFYIGIRSDVVKNINIDEIDYDKWTLEIKADNIIIQNTSITVEEPVIGFAPKSAEFYLRCEPFTSTEIIPEHTFGIINLYNIPFFINLSYTQFENRITTTNTEIIVHPNETTSHEITVNTPTWPPGIITIEGMLQAIPKHILQTGVVSLPAAPIQYFPLIKIYVGRSNYTIYESPTTGIVFQYEENLDAKYDEIKNITTYLSGNGEATVTITCVNATLLNIFHEDNLLEQMPFTIQSTNTSEEHIVSQIHFTQENTIAVITYQLELDGEIQTFKTKINVGPKSIVKEETSDNTLLIIIIGIITVLVIVYMIYSQMKYRRK